MPGDAACQLMMADVNQAIVSVIGQLVPGDPMVACGGLAGFGGVCGQIMSIMVAAGKPVPRPHETSMRNNGDASRRCASIVLPRRTKEPCCCAELDDTPAVEDMQEFGFTDPAQCPACVQYLKKESILDALLELSDQIMMAPAPAPTPDAVSSLQLSTQVPSRQHNNWKHFCDARAHVTPCRKLNIQHRPWLPHLQSYRLLPHLQAGMHVSCLEGMSSASLVDLDLRRCLSNAPEHEGHQHMTQSMKLCSGCAPRLKVGLFTLQATARPLRPTPRPHARCS